MGETPAGVTRLARPEDTDGGICDDAALIARSIGVPECFALLFDRHGPGSQAASLPPPATARCRRDC
jgi:hypothetical protein